MEYIEIMEKRHSVRDYIDKPIEKEKVNALLSEIEKINTNSDIKLNLVINDDKVFRGMLASYGKFKNVKNYIIISGEKSKNLEEKAGYYGQQLVLKAQEIGLNTCWVALTYSKGNCNINLNKNEKIVCTIALGYGVTQGTPSRSKALESISNINEESPKWFKDGVYAASLAPTATNQQKFYISQKGNIVQINSKGGFYSKIDLGIVKYHFELIAGSQNFTWC